MKEALLYEKLAEKTVHCYLCAHHCHILNQHFGFCGVRQNIDGLLYTHAYGKAIAAHVDPIEKKPLYHFLPGSKSFSLATIGCNFRCGFCQNWEISQKSFRDGQILGGAELSAEMIVAKAQDTQCQSVSYTYTEPTIFFEYALETAKLAKDKGLKNIFVTNGYMTKEALLLIKPYLDAANVDLKFFNENSYKKICAGSLEPVLATIRLMKELGIWVEVTTLIVPGENDSTQELSSIAGFLASLDKNIPWHVSRFHPDYHFTDYSFTPEGTLKKALNEGKRAGLTYIYAGNVSGFGNDTICPHCKKLLIKRQGFDLLEYNLKADRCKFCLKEVAGIFSKGEANG
ncbi:MAG: AmmeMemoRadiSam system radical SAM enzyme [Candidatus Omnitrophica bacterium]|nr:AmmeMemoRadiSam system radical SAM enzyme [Candidatus Omnitrophota bacterium]